MAIGYRKTLHHARQVRLHVSVVERDPDSRETDHPSEVESVMRLIQSGIQLGLASVLAIEEPEG